MIDVIRPCFNVDYSRVIDLVSISVKLQERMFRNCINWGAMCGTVSTHSASSTATTISNHVFTFICTRVSKLSSYNFYVFAFFGGLQVWKNVISEEILSVRRKPRLIAESLVVLALSGSAGLSDTLGQTASVTN